MIKDKNRKNVHSFWKIYHIILKKGGVNHLNKLPCTQGCFVPSLVCWFWNRRFWKFCQCIFAISLLSPLEETSTPLQKDALCQVCNWLKLTLRFWTCNNETAKIFRKKIKRLLLQKHCVCFNQTWHKSFLVEGNWSFYQLGSFNSPKEEVNFSPLINVLV